MQCYHNLALAYGTKRDREDQIQVLEKYLKIDQFSISSLMSIGQVHQERKRYKQAIQYYEKVFEYDQENVEAYIQISKCLRKQKQYQEALDQLEIAKFFDENNEKIYYKYAIILHSLQKFFQGKQLLQERIDQNPQKEDCYKNLCKYLFKYEYYEEAIKIAELIFDLEIVSNNSWANLFIGDCFSKLKKFDEAEEQYESVLLIDPENVRGLLKKGYFYLADKFNYKMAEQLFNQVIKLCPFKEQGYIGYGQTAEMQVQHDKAIQYFERCIQNCPKNVQAKLFIAMAYKQMIHLEQAQQNFEQAIEWDKENQETYFQYADMCFMFKKPQDAAEIIERFVKIDPLSDAGWFLLGEYYQKIDLQKSLEYYKECEKLNNQFPKLYWQMGQLFLKFPNEKKWEGILLIADSYQREKNSLQFLEQKKNTKTVVKVVQIQKQQKFQKKKLILLSQIIQQNYKVNNKQFRNEILCEMIELQLKK